MTATYSHMQHDSAVVLQTYWQLLLIPFWHEVNYIVFRTSHFLLLSSSFSISHKQLMDTQPRQQGQSRSKMIQLTDAISNTSLISTQHECGHRLVHHYAATAATNIMTEDAHWKIVQQTWHGTNKMQYGNGCK